MLNPDTIAELIAFAVILLLAILLMRNLLRPAPDRYRSGILCGCIVIVSSTRSLFTDAPDSLSFQLHGAAIAAMVVAIAVSATRMRSV